VKRYQVLLQNILAISEARYAVGAVPQQDIFKAQTQIAIFSARLLEFEQERATKEIEINALLNRRAGGRIEIPEDMAEGHLEASLDDMLAHARTDAPALLQEQKRVERSELASNLARKDFYPDYTVSGGYFNQGSMPSMWQFRVDFKLPTYFWRKQRAELAGQAFITSEARHNYEAADTSIQARIRADYTIATTAQKLIDIYGKSVVREAQLALESSLAGYQTGALDFLSVFSNFLNVVDYELAYHEQVMQFHLAVARLEEATGMELLP
jgi:outer membrane protein TolC